MFGRRKRHDGWADVDDAEITDELHLEFPDARDIADVEITDAFDTPLVPTTVGGLSDEAWGPYDHPDVKDRLAELADQRLDLGSVILPVLPGFQLQVEMAEDGSPTAVHLTTEHGRLTVAAYAAPKTTGQWRAVSGDLADTLRKEGATSVSVETGPWGRELVALAPAADLRFIGVDGYRWMVRMVAAGPSGSVNAGSPLVAAAHAVLRETVVRRGDEPHPVRTPLPVVLPQELAEQLAEAHRRRLAEEAGRRAAAVAQAAPQPTAPTPNAAPTPHPSGPLPQVDAPQQRRGAEGSAMQQLRR